MALATDLKDMLKETLDAKPVRAAVGAGDLAVEKLRKVPQRLSELQSKTDYKQLQNKVTEMYDELAARGKSLATRMRTQKASQELAETAKATAGKAQQTVKGAKATAETAGKAVRAGAKKVG